MLKKINSFSAAFAAAAMLVFLLATGAVLPSVAAEPVFAAEPILVAQSSRGGAPGALPDERVREYLDCRERHDALVKETGFYDFSREQHRAALDVACRIKFVDLRTGKQHGGCWIDDAWVTKNSRIFQRHGIHKNDSPDCREIFGNPVNFPVGGDGDTVYKVDCGATGQAGGRDENCQCPPEAPHARADSPDGAERCLSDNDVARIEACKEKGWGVSRAELDGGDSAFICDFPEPLRFADGRHAGCVLHGADDAVARAGLPSCDEADFDALAVAATALAARREQGVPSQLPDERVREYLDCRERDLLVEKVSRATWDDKGKRSLVHLFDAACLIKFADAATGEEFSGCWLHKSWLPIITTREAYFNPHDIYEESPFCRDIFGDPAQFPLPVLPADAVYMLNCEAVGRTRGSDGSCVCPPEFPHARTDGADGAEHCVTAEVNARAEACRANGWNLSEVVGADGESAFFCDFPVAFSFADGRHGRCVLHGSGGETARADLPSCGEADFDALAETLAARRASGAPDELPDERVREYADCRERRELIENRVGGVRFGEGGKREKFYVLDVACRVPFADAATGKEYAGCWIHKDEINLGGSRRSYFPNRGIQEDNPRCRDVFGDPAEFPADDAAYLFNCEAAGLFAAGSGRCGCPPERPREFALDGEALCVSDAAHSALESCREENWTIRKPDREGDRPTLACLIELE